MRTETQLVWRADLHSAEMGSNPIRFANARGASAQAAALTSNQARWVRFPLPAPLFGTANSE